VKRGALTSIALVVLAAGSLVYAYLFDRGAVDDADRAAGARRVFPRFDVPDVKQVVVESPAGRLVLERAGDAGSAWAMTSPRVEAADPAAVGALLEDMRVAARARDVAVDPGAAGLTSPRARGSVTLGSLRYDFELGAPAPVPEGAAYMRVNGKGVFVTDRLLAEDLLRGADAYRDRILVPYGLTETATVTVHDPEQPGPDLVLSRSGSTFRVDGAVRASRSAVEELFQGFADARADSFLDTPGPAPVVSGGVEVTLVAVEASRPRVRLRFGGACPGNDKDIVVSVEEPSPRVACVGPLVATAVRQPRSRYVDDHPFYARADEVAELRLETVGPEGHVLDLARRGSGWHERAPEDRELIGSDGDPASALVDRLVALRAIQVVPPAAGELMPANVTLTIVRADGTREVLVAGYERVGAPLRTRRGDDDAVLVLPDSAASILGGYVPGTTSLWPDRQHFK
jgi:hypothetical protein